MSSPDLTADHENLLPDDPIDDLHNLELAEQEERIINQERERLENHGN